MEVDIQKLVVSLARENPGWGYPKIRDALRGLKLEIGPTTVADMLAATGIEPAPERNRKRTWKQLLKSHWDTLYACDFFSVEVLGVFGTVRYMVFFVIEVKTRAVHIVGSRTSISMNGWLPLSSGLKRLPEAHVLPISNRVCCQRPSSVALRSSWR